MNPLRRILRTNRGVSIVEYAILLALVALVGLGAVSWLGSSIGHHFASLCVAGHCLGTAEPTTAPVPAN